LQSGSAEPVGLRVEHHCHRVERDSTSAAYRCDTPDEAPPWGCEARGIGVSATRMRPHF
jgi:hypothetical protein